MSAGVRLLPTGTANTASVIAAFDRLGVAVEAVVNPKDISDAAHLVVPGVGAFGAGVAAIDAALWRDPLVTRLEVGRPTLAICLGMQLLCEKSDESPGSAGLGVLGVSVTRFETEDPVPQLGWNDVRPDPNSRFVQPGWAYFANSYRVPSVPAGWVGSTAQYGGRFMASVERGDVLACQFHPELSGDWGLSLLDRWVKTTRGGS